MWLLIPLQLNVNTLSVLQFDITDLLYYVASMSVSIQTYYININTNNKDNEEKIELLTFKKDNHPVYSQFTVIWKYCSEDKECHKHLGLIFQSNCKWEKHINSICFSHLQLLWKIRPKCLWHSLSSRTLFPNDSG